MENEVKPKGNAVLKAIKEHVGDRLSIYILVIILSSLVFFYYFSYVPGNEKKLNEHALRLMENKTRSIKEKTMANCFMINSLQAE